MKHKTVKILYLYSSHNALHSKKTELPSGTNKGTGLCPHCSASANQLRALHDELKGNTMKTSTSQQTTQTCRFRNKHCLQEIR